MECLCFRPPPAASLVGICRGQRQPIQVAAAVNRPTVEGPTSRRSHLFPIPLARLWPTRREDDGNEAEEEEENNEEEEEVDGRRRKGNWVTNICRVGAIWGGEKGDEDGEDDEGAYGGDGDRCCCGDDSCDVVDEEAVEFDRDSFSRLLRKVSLVEARLYAKLSYLGNLAYSIPEIKPDNLRKHRLRLITSSLERRLKSSDGKVEEEIKRAKEAEEERKSSKKNGISAAAAYQIAASAASYVQLQTKNILPFRSSKKCAASSLEREGSGDNNTVFPEETSFVVTTNSVTAVVAAKEEVKAAVAKDLNSSQASLCEWYICDDDASGTRYFIIQGSESLSSWQANLLFEPVQFEGLNVLVHRGIYEAAKGIYEQMLPEVEAHLEARGNFATLRFTGHSLGGSLSLLVNLMLLIRGKVPSNSLLPVITFGAPTIMCGGNRLLKELGLPLNHVQAITMPRDIVPRAFSCNYPDHVADILKAVNRNFRNHPCLKHKKVLYEPMGELLILQPNEKLSPHHHLLPSDSGLYAMVRSSQHPVASERALKTAMIAFLNSPHPLEILSDRSAYGSKGTVTRDHDMTSYLKSIRYIVSLELKSIRKNKVGQQFVGNDTAVIFGLKLKINNPLHKINFSVVYELGVNSVKQLRKVVISRNVQIAVVLLIPVRMLVLKALSP